MKSKACMIRKCALAHTFIRAFYAHLHFDVPPNKNVQLWREETESVRGQKEMKRDEMNENGTKQMNKYEYNIE